MTLCISGVKVSAVNLQMLNWNMLTRVDELEYIREKSFHKSQVLFKHSTRCGTSSLVLNRIERASNLPDAEFYFLDLIRFREISDKIAAVFNVYHESPQVLLIKNGVCLYSESHMAIDMEDLKE